VIAVLVGLLTAGCADEPDVAPRAAFNDTDVMFLQMMLAYQGQSLKLVPLAKAKASRDDVRTLAAAIEVTQADEAGMMVGWLQAWKQPITAASDPAVHEGHGGMHDLDVDELGALQSLTGPDFDKAFLNLLIGHQHNAVEVARMELSSGADQQVKEFAQRVDRSRGAEIQQMLTMVAG
jgi:uncharacterized protein (DUF305 family)